jgi:predicted HTH transcriptional regulator
MGYIENWGRGIEKIVAACERLGAPRPEYKVIGYGITLYLYALETAVIGDPKGSELASNDTLSGGTDSEEFRRVPKSSEVSALALTQSEESVYTYLLNKGSARTSEIANAVALTPRGTLKVLKRLEEKHLVYAEGSTSSRVYRTISI